MESPDQPDFLDANEEIKLETDVDGYGSYVDIQTTAGNENHEAHRLINIFKDNNFHETHRLISIFKDNKKLDWVAGRPPVIDTHTEIKIEKDIDDYASNVDTQTTGGDDNLETHRLINICNDNKKLDWVAGRPSMIYGPPEVFDTQTEIKVEKDIDGRGSHVDTQAAAGDDNLETHRRMNICNDNKKLDWVAGRPSMIYGPPEVFDTQIEIKVEKDIDGRGSHVNTKTIVGNENHKTQQLTNLFNDSKKLDWVAGRSSVTHGPTEVIDTHTKIKVEKDIDVYGSYVDTQAAADNETPETYQLMNTCIEDKTLNCVAGHAKLNYESPSKSHKSLEMNDKNLYTKGKGLICAAFNKSLSQPPSFSEIKFHSCHTCGNSFASQTLLRNHRVVHTGEKPFKCKFCRREFSYSSSLSRHMQLHTGNRPYQCNYCGKSYSKSGSLKYHMQYAHDAEQTFKLLKCEICERRFSTTRSLSDHMRIHSGDKPYECGSCDMSFTKHSNLKQHLLTHKGVRTYTCGKCNGLFTYAGIRYHKLYVHKEDNIDTENPKVKHFGKAFRNKIKFKGLIHRSKQLDNATISVEQRSTMKYDVTDTNKKYNDQVDETTHPQASCLLEQIEKPKDLSSGINDATKFCNLDVRRRMALSNRNKHNNV